MNQGFQMGWPRGGAREAPRRSLQLLLHHLAPIVEEPRHTIERASWVAYTRRWQAASCETSRGMFVCDCARVRAREETGGIGGASFSADRCFHVSKQGLFMNQVDDAASKRFSAG